MTLTRSHMLLLLALLTVLAYANTTHNAFLWDDHALITNNHRIRNERYLPVAFRSDLFPDQSTGSVRYYRPLQTATYIADYALWGLSPAGYHFTNLLLHLTCVLLLALLIEQLAANRTLAFAVAALFAVHPVLTNAVAYVAGRADPLAFAAMLGAWLLWLRRRPLPFTFALLCYLAALSSRENAFLFPLLILLHSLILNRNNWRRALLDALPFALLAVAFGLWRTAVLSLAGTASHTTWTLPWTVRLQIPFRALATYLGLLAWPAHLQMERQIVFGGSWLYVLTFAGTIATAALVWLARRSRLACFGVCWFAVTLLPVSGLFSLNATMAEHWLYVPCSGLFLAVATLMPRSRIMAAVGLLALAALTARTMARNRDWQDGKRLFVQTKAAAPHSTAARVNLGLEHAQAGETNQAVKEWIASVQAAPGDSHVWNNLAAFYLKQGELVRAEAVAEESLRQAPGNVGALSRLAEIWEQRGKFPMARLCHLRAIGDSLSVPLRLEYGQFLLRQRRRSEALHIAEEACAMEPPHAEAHNLRGVVLAEMGRFDEAQAAFQTAQKLDRHSRNATRNLERLRKLRQ
ncbi:MAG: tetratricopeptide repeat protein [Verrucomicrobia bacterium]|nr:tetratricopeptide repeat protein [Verrucomicrobiota bacterium]